jgi:predicted dehydrogenase
MEASRQSRLRHVIIGVAAGVFGGHRPALALPTVDLVAVSDINTAVGMQRASELQCAFYKDYRQMLRETQPDVAVIMTPHFLHPSITIDCLQAGCHVLVEKPIALQVADADAMIEAASHYQRLLGLIVQHRFRPEVRAAKKLLQEGLLGDVQRVELSAVWTRPASYYNQAPWRGTWAGEGGGVLLNQASHNLDLLCHLVGMPARLYAWTRRLLHQIETEDTAQVMLEWPGGALGALHISSAEADVAERIKILGTQGYLELLHGQLSVYRLDADMKEYRINSTDPYQPAPLHAYTVPLEDGAGDHVAVYRSFHDAILSGHHDAAFCDGVQGRMELELANAIIFSNYTHSEVQFPLDRQRYTRLLEELRAQSKNTA